MGLISSRRIVKGDEIKVIVSTVTLIEQIKTHKEYPEEVTLMVRKV